MRSLSNTRSHGVAALGWVHQVPLLLLWGVVKPKWQLALACWVRTFSQATSSKCMKSILSSTKEVQVHSVGLEVVGVIRLNTME